MAAPVSATGLLGQFLANTNASVVISTPVTLWGYTVYNGTSGLKNAGVGSATNAIVTLPYATGATSVPTYGLAFSQVAAKVDDTNLSIILHYSPGT